MARSSGKPVRIIDHEPLNHGRAEANASGFGKRGQGLQASRDDIPAADPLPRESNLISEYFINRVKEHQKTRRRNPGRQEGPGAARPTLRRSAIRDTDFTDIDMQDEMQIPFASLAAVAMLAFAIPLGFIYATENMSGFSGRNGVDPITTSSVPGARSLEVRNVSMVKMLKNGTSVVTINGEISNSSVKPKTLMPLTISLRDGDGKEVQSWRHRIGKSMLDQGSTLRFMTSAIDYSGRAKTAHIVARTAKPAH